MDGTETSVVLVAPTVMELQEFPIPVAGADDGGLKTEIIGVCGSDDALSDYFGQRFVNRPPIHRPWVFGQLEEVINRPFDGEGSYALTAGSSRLAVETRDDRDNRCIHCGACMTGCANQAIYSAGNDIGRYQAQGLIRRTITGKALTVRGAPPEVVVQKNGAHETVGPFDRVYVAAGCIGSTEIVMRSLDLRDGPLVTDNAVYTFPILYLGRHCGGPDDDDHYGLTNLLIGCRPSGGDGRFAMIQVYPNIDYLWRYFLPVALWPIAQPLGRALRRRLLWGRVFLDEAYSQRYAATMSDDGAFALRLARPPEPLARIPGLWASIRRQIGRRGFMLPKVPPVRHATSSHYAASLPLGSTYVDGDGRFGPDAYVCDSAVFPDGPAASLTLTIMALACRIAHRSLPGVI